VLTTLYRFCSKKHCADGDEPTAGLVQGTDGKFYGTTGNFGANGHGTVFKITLGGTLTTLYSFCSQGGCTDGSYPEAGLIQDTTGNFYGTTSIGGTNNDGTVFKITPSGTLTTLHSFDGTDGALPQAPLVQGTNEIFYGTTVQDGHNRYGGTIFKTTPSGTLTTLYSFCQQGGCADGEYPVAALVQDTNGNFYGTTLVGGTTGGACTLPDGCGTVFSLSVSLGPFIETRPTSGTVGTAVTILGTDLTGVTNVRFNGIESKFTVVSGSEITTTVPKGATTGPVRVITPSGKLSSNVPFTVK
jgi:uncharacterized repeat protein (TIGR03803 family)